jgi:hypothetical protein
MHKYFNQKKLKTMKFTRKAETYLEGGVKDRKSKFSTDSGVLDKSTYGFKRKQVCGNR